MGIVVRSGPLTLAQQRWWLRLYWREQGEFDIAWKRRWEVPEGLSIDVDVAYGAIAALVKRHEILRTVFVFGPDNLPAQIVFDASGFPLPVSVADLSTLDEFRQVQIEPLTGGSSFSAPLWEMRLFADNEGRVRAVNLIFEHIIIDGSGLLNLWEQFLDLCRGQKAELAVVQPLDRQIEEARRLSASVERAAFRRELAAHVPQVIVPPTSSSMKGPRFLLSSGRYEGLLSVIDEICRGGPASRSMLLMFAIGWLFCRYAGTSSLLCSSTVANRMAGDDGVDCISRHIDILLEIDPTTTLRKALESLCVSTLHSYEEDLRFGPTTFETTASLAAERGIGSVRPLYFNYQGRSQATDPHDVHRSGGVTVTRCDRWRPDDVHWLNVVWINVDDSDVVVDLDVDTRMVPERVVHTMIEVLPSFLRLIADSPDAPVHLADALLPEGFTASTDCRIIGGNWVNSANVKEILRSCRGVKDAVVDSEADALVAYLSLEPATALIDIHDYMTASLNEQIDVAAPHRYRPMPPADGRSGETRWPEGVSAGDGWRPTVDQMHLAPTTEAERELCAAIRETHGRVVTDIAQTYVAAGGRIILAPAVMEKLRRRGLVGLGQHHFSGPYTLRAIARCLVPVRDRLRHDAAEA